MLWRAVKLLGCVAGWGGDPGGWAGAAWARGVRGGSLREGRGVRGGGLGRVARGGAMRSLEGCWAAGCGGLAVTVGAW